MSLQISSCGNGPDLALVHGWGLGAGVWSGVADALAAHCRVHLVSLPGYAGAPADLIDAIVTEKGVVERPDAAKMAQLMCRKRLH